MITSADLTELPREKHELRNRLRVAGFDLVRYTSAYAIRTATPYRHPPSEYTYGIHRIVSIRPDGQLVIARNTHHSSESWLENWVNHFVQQEKPRGLKLLSTWFKDYWLLTAVVPPFSVALLGMAAIGDAATKREHSEREQLLSVLKDKPVFDDEA